MPIPVPDLRRLTVDVPTSLGVFATGLLVEVVAHSDTARRVKVCLDGPGRHLSPCRCAWLPVRAVTAREALADHLTGLRAPALAWDPAAA